MPNEHKGLDMKERVERRARELLQKQAAANHDEALNLAEEEDRAQPDDDLGQDSAVPSLGEPAEDHAPPDLNADVREQVEARASEILARINRANAANGVEQTRDDFATDRAESEEDLRRDLLQGDGDGDVLNVSNNRLETRHEQRHRLSQSEREMTVKQLVEREAAEIYANQPERDRNDEEGDRIWRR